MGGWGCPHDVNGRCMRVNGRDCDPGMKGCILFGRVTSSDPEKNRSRRPQRRAADGRRQDDR